MTGGLAVLAAAVTVVVWRAGDADLAAGVGGAISLAAGVASAWLAWAAYEKPPDLDLTAIADQLATAVFDQWDRELKRRQVGDPHPLPVAWDPADPTLTDDWASIRRRAESGAWPPEPAGAPWATNPAQLAGHDNALVDVLGRIPTGRLVVLGEPGAGKTILVVRLLLALHARRTLGGPVPVFLPLASWNPTDQDLYSWLEARLLLDHTGLAAPHPDATGRGHNRARALLASRLIMPILDGLDELPPALRATALATIGETLPDGQGLVLTCRKREFRWAIRPSYGIDSKLTGAAAVALRPLTPTAVTDYLQDTPGGLVAIARWDQIVASLTATPSPPAARVLTTPLMASLAHTIYNPRRGEPLHGLPDPVELLNPTRFPTPAAVREHLFDGFILAAYRHDPRHPQRWSADKAQRWLRFLARHLEHRLHGTPDLAWWQLHTAVPRASFGLVAGLGIGLGAGLVTGLVGLVAGPGGPVRGLALGLILGLLGPGLAFWLPGGPWDPMAPTEPSRGVRWQPRWSRLAWGLGLGSGGGSMFGFYSSIMVQLTGVHMSVGVHVSVGGRVLRNVFVGVRVFAGGRVLGNTLVGGLVGVLVGVLVGGLLGGLTRVVAELRTATSPEVVLMRDRRAFDTLVCVVGLAFGLLGGLMFGLAPGLMLGLAVGLVVGSGVGLSETAWGWFAMARLWLALSGKVPWRFMGFLADAHERGVLRQVGAVYQFRHIELQRRLAP